MNSFLSHFIPIASARQTRQHGTLGITALAFHVPGNLGRGPIWQIKWYNARERLDIVELLWDNRYRSLGLEAGRIGSPTW